MAITNKAIDNLINEGLCELQKEFSLLDEISLVNQEKVLNAFKNSRLALRHFNGTTGYGYDDEGRDTLKRVYAEVLDAEACVVTPNIVSGTHAISLGLFSILKRGDKVLSISGKPYDTLDGVISGSDMSLSANLIEFNYIPLVGANFDYDKISDYLNNNSVQMIYIQRSRGYAEREAISIENIQSIVKFIKELGFDGCIFVDNCYGEFVEKLEPTSVGCNVIAGSLIKNIGGGLAPTGGYIAGDKKYIDMVESRLTAPCIGGEVGSYAFGYQYFYQGLFMAPHTVNQALKGSMLLGYIMEKIGYETIPKAKRMPYDITRSVKLGDKDKLIKFIRSVQAVSPVDSFLTCEPWDMPGYSDPVIMAAGCFVQGASIELSCDAPIREPFVAYIQGGLTIEHSIIAIKEILKNL